MTRLAAGRPLIEVGTSSPLFYVLVFDESLPLYNVKYFDNVVFYYLPASY
jgi:hypothetical protein